MAKSVGLRSFMDYLKLENVFDFGELLFLLALMLLEMLVLIIFRCGYHRRKTSKIRVLSCWIDLDSNF